MKSMFKILISVFLFSSAAILLYADSVDFLHVITENSKYSSSSNLIEKDKPENYYGAGKAFDGDSGTSWCEGKKDAGEGEYIILETEPVEIYGVTVLNGFGKFRHLYFQNNRVKDFRLTLYPVKGKEKIITAAFGVDLCGKSLAGGKLTIESFCEEEVENYRTDRKAFNKCVVDKKDECILDEYNGGGQNILLKTPMTVKKVKLEILSVYRGEKFNDTCISEFKLLNYNRDSGPYEKYKAEKY